MRLRMARIEVDRAQSTRDGRAAVASGAMQVNERQVKSHSLRTGPHSALAQFDSFIRPAGAMSDNGQHVNGVDLISILSNHPAEDRFCFRKSAGLRMKGRSCKWGHTLLAGRFITHHHTVEFLERESRSQEPYEMTVR